MPSTSMSRSAPRWRRVVRVAALCVIAGGLVALTPQARADEYLTQINKGYLAFPQDKRTDLVLLPLVAKMDAPPARFAVLSQAALLPADLAAFADAKAWAEKPAQKAVIDALATVTKEKKWKDSYGWGLPYGVEAVPTELVEAKLYTELGDPPTLAGARHLWLPALDKVACLVNVEATRLAAEGKPSDAIEVLLRWSHVCRQLADRQMFVEARWGLSHMLQALERVRDVTYADMNGAKALDLSKIPSFIELVGRESFLEVGRLQFPHGDRLAAEQIAARVFGTGDAKNADEINKAAFGPTLAKLGATEYPLRLFAESARWRSAAGAHADGRDTKAKVESVMRDFNTRWQLDWFDRRHATPTEYTKLEPARFALISRAMPDLRELFDLRQLVSVELLGARLSFAVAGYVGVNKSFPPQLTAIRPRWVDRIEADPFSRDFLANNQRRIPEYFIPMRRRVGMGPKEEPKPQEIYIVPPEGDAFSVKLTDSTFVLYSVGANAANDYVKQVQNTSQMAFGTDYLLWPPVLSLYRQHLKDSQQLK